ncbi:MAG: hypothetical protein DRI57_18900, partial [Deltaproteobacteria bacterium]
MTPFSDDNDITNIVNFCLNIYKLQLEVPRSVPSRIVPVAPQSDDADAVYELHVKRDAKWSSRRMAIAKLGGESGSKSKCFKVIYDDMLVIKIPPSPIKDFSEYISSIRAESRIAVRLAPKIEFVAPGVTALMRKIRNFPKSADISPSELEKKYVRWLEQNRAFQNYLKIDDTFVFFMDLSKHSFLSYVVDRMHDKGMLRGKIREEIAESISLLWDILGFEGKYGPENLSICFDMNKVYSDYATSISVLLRRYALSVSAYERQKWFSIYLAEKKVKKEEYIASPGFVTDLNRMLGKIVRESEEEVAAYRRTVWDYVSQKTFSQNKPKLSGLLTNILRLLASLNESGIAIRDLKPDNLFVVGNTELSAEDYSLGLIDFETAVEFKRKGSDLKGQMIEQPLLGGTPSYAPPSHLFKNEVLISIFGELPRILHFQDWHAALGTIYNVITGDWLFENTRRYLSRIPLAMRQAAKKKKPATKVFRKSSQV